MGKRWLVLLFALLISSGARAATILETRESLITARLSAVTLEQSRWLRATLAPGSRAGTLETPVIAQAAFDRAVVSWNALTPAGASLEIAVRARIGSRWTRYYRVARWSSDPRLERRSFAGERDADGFLDTDTLKLTRLGNAVQIRVTLEAGAAPPTLTRLAVTSFSSRTAYRAAPTVSDRRAWGVDIAVPVRSQMIYPYGGEVWCSPTTMTMLLEFWGARLGRPLADSVPAAVSAIWDPVYDGGGNWSLNTAYAGGKGLQAYVDRLSSLVAAEAYIRRGVPLVVSIAWKLGELRGAKLPRSNGHVLLLRGFTKSGDPITNDPAGKTESARDILTVYSRAEFERAWFGHSGGVAYVIGP
jgi:hypothetical protein